MQYIDPHTHIHTLTWNDHESVSMAGLRLAITTAGNPAVNHKVFEGALTPDDLTKLWMDAVDFSRMVYSKHFFDVRVAAGIHQLAAAGDPERSLKALEQVLELPEVVAVGEIGLDPTQYFGAVWSLEDQEQTLLEQFKLARACELPIILHTPTVKRSLDFMIQLDEQAATEPDSDEPFKMRFLRRDLELLAEAGVDLSRVVVDHVDGSIMEFVKKETPCYMGISVGLRMRSIRPRDVADLVALHGPERVFINSDAAGHTGYDELAVPRAILEMKRLGVAEADIEQVVWNNPRNFFSLDVD